MDIWDDYNVNAFSDDEEIPLRKRKVIRERTNHFEKWDQHEFFQRFRLSSRTVENLIEELYDVLAYPTNRNCALTPADQLLLSLRFYATGSFLEVAGDFSGVHKTTVSKTVRRVSLAIAALRPQIVKMPQTEEEISECKRYFYLKARFPLCIGAIDCSHIKILSPGGNNAEIFRNRKQYFSLNVQTVADANLKIMDIVARWPGSAHDAHIFRKSSIMNRFETGEFENCLLVGDSGYACKNYLLTPLLQPRTQVEHLYNESQIRTRNPVERSYGVWKRRFPGLALGLRVKIPTTQAIVVATAVLHNIACEENERIPMVTDEERQAIDLVNNNPPNAEDFNNVRVDNNAMRRQLILTHFANL